MPGMPGRSGRPQKPTAIHKLEGTYDERYHGAYDHPIDELKGSPRPPCNMSDDAALMFEHICRTYENIEGILAPIDTYQLELMCRWFAKARSLTKRMEMEEDDDESAKLERRAKQAWEVFDKGAKQFGLSPTARAALRAINAVGGSKGKATDPLTEFGIV